MAVWRQLHFTAQQHKQILTNPTTPQINGSSLLSLQDVMLKHQLRFEKRRLSENDLDGDIKPSIKLPKLSPIENNTCPPTTLPLSLHGGSLISGMSLHMSPSESIGSDKPYNALMSHREKAQNQQYLERLRRMNERTSARERGSRVNFDQHNSAKTVREELANRKQQAKHGKSECISSSAARLFSSNHFSSANGTHFHRYPARTESGRASKHTSPTFLAFFLFRFPLCI